MFENIIKFSAVKEYVEAESEKDTFPVPIKFNMPEWFKKLDHTVDKITVKGCLPFLDTLTSGYLLKTPQDMLIKHGIEIDKDDPNNSIKKGSFNKCPYKRSAFTEINLGAITDGKGNFNDNWQAEGWPNLQKNHGGPVHKFINPWHIKTPKGYSCLFLPVLNNNDDRFEIIPGIVDTDEYTQEINFPMLLNGYKYPMPIEFVIKRATPYVQIFPFKRESWKMKIETVENKERSFIHSLFNTNLINNYKLKHWKKKSYK